MISALWSDAVTDTCKILLIMKPLNKIEAILPHFSEPLFKIWAIMDVSLIERIDLFV